MADSPSFKSNELTPEDLEVIRAFLAADDFAMSLPGDEVEATPAMIDSSGQVGVLDKGEDEDEMLAIFASEVDEDIADMRSAFESLQKGGRVDPQALPALSALRRGGHKIRGTSAAIGCNAMSTIAHAVETLVELVRSQRIALPDGLQALGFAIDALEKTLESVVETRQESILPLLSLEERFAELGLPLRDMSLIGEDGGDLPDEIGETTGGVVYARVEGRRLEQLLLHAGQLAEQQQEIDYARQEVESALAELYEAQARLRRIESIVATMPAMPMSPSSGEGQPVPSIEELAPSSLVARILHESAQRTGHAYEPGARAAQSPPGNMLAETMLWDELELDHYTEAQVLAHSLSEAIADLATVTSQLQQSLAHLDAMIKKQAAKADAIRNDALVLQATSVSGLAQGPQREVRVPTLTDRHGLLVRAGEQQAIVPFSQVQRIDYSGQLPPGQVYRLDALLGFSPASFPPSVEAPAMPASPVLILRESAHGTPRVYEEREMGEMEEVRGTSQDVQAKTSPPIQAIQVDEALGQVELHVKPLPPALQRPGVSGATINRTGEVVLALDLPALIRQYEWSRQTSEEVATPGDALDAGNFQAAWRPIERAPRILIVDDSVFMRRTLSQTLASQGYVLLEARDGVEALEQLTGAAPDVLLLDLEMPNLNGYELLNILTVRALLPDLKIILLTSRSSDKHQQRAKELGIHAYLTKPCSEETLLETVAGVLQKR